LRRERHRKAANYSPKTSTGNTSIIPTPGPESNSKIKNPTSGPALSQLVKGGQTSKKWDDNKQTEFLEAALSSPTKVKEMLMSFLSNDITTKSLTNPTENSTQTDELIPTHEDQPGMLEEDDMSEDHSHHGAPSKVVFSPADLRDEIYDMNGVMMHRSSMTISNVSKAEVMGTPLDSVNKFSGCEDLKNLIEIHDVEDELRMLKKLFNQQIIVIN
jgi:hypothetical protein